MLSMALLILIGNTAEAFNTEGNNLRKRDGSGSDEGVRRGYLNNNLPEDVFAHRESVQEALANSDYDAFQTLQSNCQRNNEREISESDFEKMVEAYNLRESGNYEEAREIMQEAGLSRRGQGRGQRIGKGSRGIKNN